MNSLTYSNVMEEIKQIEFSKLRHAYITVKSFIENESADDLESLKTKIVNDLGLKGDDNSRVQIAIDTKTIKLTRILK